MLLAAAFLAAAYAPSPQLCRTVHGKMFASNGTPDLRIWVIDTKRVLGVSHRNAADDAADVGVDDLPGKFRRLWKGGFDTDLYGDFRVCAWKRQKPGEMQFVRVVDGNELVVAPAR